MLGWLTGGNGRTSGEQKEERQRERGEAETPTPILRRHRNGQMKNGSGWIMIGRDV